MQMPLRVAGCGCGRSAGAGSGGGRRAAEEEQGFESLEAL
jgi:hypothetical protein